MAKRAAKTAKAAATSRRKEGQRSAKSAEASAPTLDKAPTARQPKPAAARPAAAKAAKPKPSVAAKSPAKSARSAAAAPARKTPKKAAANGAISKAPRAKAAPAEPKTKAAKGAAPKPAKSATTRPAKPDTKAATAPTSGNAVAKQTPRKAKAPPKPRYLAAELGQPLDPRGEPIGASSSRAASDEDLQKYALQLWRQMQSGRVVNRYTRAIERAGLTVDEVWTAGLADMRTTSSTADEIRRYRQKILFRANLLEAIFAETIADLRRLDGIEPGDAPKRESA
jgi:hypothetical protein